MPQLMPGLRLDPDGAELHPAGLDAAALHAVGEALSDQPADQAGVRLFGIEVLRPLLSASGPIGELAATAAASRLRPVRAILFDKSAETNWSLGWHQDRVVAVRERIDVEGFGPWSRKHGALHVAPPFEVLAGMITVRVHLDPVTEDNAPLLVAPGSHRLGRVSEKDVPAVVEACGVAACLARPGDVWLYATPVLHASERARAGGRRRVLQVDYAAGPLPGGLDWLGV